MKNKLAIFGTKNFNNSLDEIKEDLGFSLIYFDFRTSNKLLFSSISAVIIDNKIFENRTILPTVNEISNIPILLLENHNYKMECKFDEKISLPINLMELKSKIINLITAYKFHENSSVPIKKYILDKNEKKLKAENKFIIITEREVHLIELLFNEKKPLTKKDILKKIWKYADDADTHTVETHIYRLRKKILNQFQDDNFIINVKSGYSI